MEFEKPHAQINRSIPSRFANGAKKTASHAQQFHTRIQSQSQIYLLPTASRPVCPGVRLPSETHDKIAFTSIDITLDSWRFIIMGQSLWRQDGSVIYGCCWASPAQSFSGLYRGTRDHSLISQSWDSLTWRACFRARFLYSFPPGTDWSSSTSGPWVPFLLPLTTHRPTVELF
jgi:hypothetical protein